MGHLTQDDYNEIKRVTKCAFIEAWDMKKDSLKADILEHCKGHEILNDRETITWFIRSIEYVKKNKRQIGQVLLALSSRVSRQR